MRKILVVEDNPTNMSFFVAVLEHGGHKVLQAEDAVAGIRLAREAHPDLIFMDIQLPGMGGLEATRQLKGDEERCRAADCDGCVWSGLGMRGLAPTPTLPRATRKGGSKPALRAREGVRFAPSPACGVTSDLAAVFGSLVEWLVVSPRRLGWGRN